jgi:hypothetical protein
VERAVDAMAGNMTTRRIWIGDPFDPEFEWRKPSAGPAPRPVAPELPAADRLWEALGRRFERGQLGAHRTADDDWIGLASRRELEALIDEAFAGEDHPDLAALRELVRGLDPKTIYYLVAARARRGDAGP